MESLFDSNPVIETSHPEGPVSSLQIQMHNIKVNSSLLWHTMTRGIFTGRVAFAFMEAWYVRR